MIAASFLQDLQHSPHQLPRVSPFTCRPQTQAKSVCNSQNSRQTPFPSISFLHFQPLGGSVHEKPRCHILPAPGKQQSAPPAPSRVQPRLAPARIRFFCTSSTIRLKGPPRAPAEKFPHRKKNNTPDLLFWPPRFAILSCAPQYAYQLLAITPRARNAFPLGFYPATLNPLSHTFFHILPLP